MMTEIEALKLMKIEKECINRDCDRDCAKCDILQELEDLNNAYDIAINTLEKQIPKKPEHTLIKHGKHTWRKKGNGEVDCFAWDFDYHNGVVCEVCGEKVCVHCNPEYDELTDCEEEYWNCPFCEKILHYNAKYCDCGQRIDFGE